jgi:D-psicose/D-tagatose/L-ribulose 3-epimerase
MKYSITLASFRKIETLEQTLAKLTHQDFDAVEMFGEPEQVDAKKLLSVFNSYNMPVCGITGMWGAISKDGWKRKLLSSDPVLVRAAEEYVYGCIEMCNILNGKEMNICLFADDRPDLDKTHGTISMLEKQEFVARAIPIMRRLCRTAKDYGVELVLEPLNRYSTPYCASARDVLAIAQEVELLGILLDTFHMNIEEDSIADAIQSCSNFLRHMHFADNNRKMPGFAHIDFYAIMKSLQRMGYDGYASFEPNISDTNYEDKIKKGLEFVKQIEMQSRVVTAV